MTITNQADWQRVEALLHETLERPAAQRESFLQRACGGDEALRREVASLLAASDTDTVLERGVAVRDKPLPAALPSAELPAGTPLGPWRLLQPIGRGGMGEVYLAERADGQFQQQVAIKLLRAEAGEHLERFQAERQILARLEHPGIARLLDGGPGPDGRPYMVMEFIAGQPLTRFCKDRGLTLSPRLALFDQVCDAVSFAHANLIVHRDLKSGNILVTAQGRVKLLDFGVAKLLSSSAWPGEGEVTHAAPLTPDHAAPEQLLGKPITTATDVYALGIVLYELLTGRSPWLELRQLPVSIALTRILRQDPRPASVAAALAQGPVPARLLRGDLDAIIAKALRKEPQARYPTVAALSADLQAYRRGEPVSAGPAGTLYHLWKFVRRHRVAMAVATGFVATLSAFTWRLALERDRALDAEQRAVREADAASQVTEYLVSLFKAAAPEQAGGQAVAPRRLVDLGRAQLEEQLLEQPQLRGRMLATLGQLYSELGVVPDAIASLATALHLERASPSADPLRVAQYLHDLGEAQRKIREFDKAEAYYTESLALREQHLQADDIRVGETLLGLGAAQEANGRNTDGVRALERAQRLFRQAKGENSVELARAQLAIGLSRHGAGQWEESRGLVQDAVRIFRKNLGSGHREYLDALGSYGQLLWEQGENAEAEAVLREVLDKATPIYGSESISITRYQSVLANALSAMGRVREAVTLQRRLIEVERRVAGADSPDLAVSLVNLASDLLAIEEHDEALAYMQEALRIYGSPATAPASPDAYQAWLLLAKVLSGMRRLDEALQVLQQEPPAEWEGPRAEGLRAARLAYLGDCYRLQGRLAQARQAYDDVEALARANPNAQGRNVESLRYRRASLLAEEGEHARALAEYRTVLARHIEAQGPDTLASIRVQLDVAESLMALGEVAEADSLARQIAPLLERELGPGSRTRQRLVKLMAAIAH